MGENERLWCNAVPHTSEKVYASGGARTRDRRTTLRLLRHFVESFCRITSSSKSNFVECIFVEYDTESNFRLAQNIS